MSLTIPVKEIVRESTNPLLKAHDSWARVDLGEVAEIQNGAAFKSSLFTKNDGWPLIRIRDVGKDTTECFYSGEFEKRYIIQPGDLIVGMDGDFRCSRWNGPRALLNQRVCRLWPITDGYEPRFLDVVLPAYLDAIHEQTSSVTVTHLSSRDLQQVPLPLPPLAEQKRIVAKVEQVLARVNAARERLAKAPTILKRFRQSVLAAACSGRLTADWRERSVVREPASALIRRIARSRGVLDEELSQDTSEVENSNEWITTTLGFLAEPTLGRRPFITSGSRGWAQFVSTTGPLFIRSENINTDCLELTRAVRVAPPLGPETERSRVQPGDLLLTITGNNVGRTAVVPNNCPSAHVSQHVAIIRVTPFCNVRYLWLWLRSIEHGQNQLRNYFYGYTKPGLNLDQVKNVQVELPPLDEQDEIVHRVDALFKLSDAIERRVYDGAKRAEKLTQAVLAKAFRGELVPTEAELAEAEGRDYETAEALLERIRRERAAAEPPMRDPRRARTARQPIKRKVTVRPTAETSDIGAIEVTSDRPRKATQARSKLHGRNGQVEDDPIAYARDAFGDGAFRDRETAIREIARVMAVERLSPRMRETASGILRAAVRRGILNKENGQYSLAARTATDYSRDDLIDALRSSINGVWTDRHEAIRATARHLGYRRAGPVFQIVLRSAINGAIRRKLVESNGSQIRRSRS